MYAQPSTRDSSGATIVYANERRSSNSLWCQPRSTRFSATVSTNGGRGFPRWSTRSQIASKSLTTSSTVSFRSRNRSCSSTSGTSKSSGTSSYTLRSLRAARASFGRFSSDGHARGRLSLRTAPPGGRGRAVRRLDLQLPGLPAADRERLRHAGRIQAEPGADQRYPQGLLADLRRGGQEGARPALLSRVRLAGLLHGADGAGPDRRLGRLVRRPDAPAADRVGVRLATASMDRPP